MYFGTGSYSSSVAPVLLSDLAVVLDVWKCLHEIGYETMSNCLRLRQKPNPHHLADGSETENATRLEDEAFKLVAFGIALDVFDSRVIHNIHLKHDHFPPKAVFVFSAHDCVS